MLRKRYEEETGSLAEERAKQEAEEHLSLMAWNDAENLRLRKIRWDRKIQLKTLSQLALTFFQHRMNVYIIVPASELRVQKETEASEQRRKEAAILRQQELENYIKEKEREILQLQVGTIHR